MAAIDEIISTTSELSHDWVARRELLERRIEAAAYLEREFHHVYGASTTRWTSSTLHNEEWRQVTTTSASSVVSDACDEWYRQAPIVRNDLINRHELTSQAAKARRLTLEACLLHAGEENLGIDGYGPDKTLYLSVLAAYGLHRRRKDGSWSFCDPDPKSTVNPVWSHMMERIQSAQRIGVDDLYNELAQLHWDPCRSRPNTLDCCSQGLCRSDCIVRTRNFSPGSGYRRVRAPSPKP